jgi:hypothetical protein
MPARDVMNIVRWKMWWRRGLGRRLERKALV